jgi:uncharacterized protein YndB with AHSA1/START domain
MDLIERTLEVTRPVDVVWARLATPHALGTWLGGTLDVDLRAGAKGTFTPDGAPPRRVSVLRVEPERELRFVWWYDEGDLGLVTLRVDPTDGGAVVRVREQRVGGYRSLLGLRASA